MTTKWQGTSSIGSIDYTCGYCGHEIATPIGYQTNGNAKIYICHWCDQPTYFDGDMWQVPGASFGNQVEHIPDDVSALYNEARNCMQVNAYTASILCSRKLLMNIAVSRGAKEGLKFIQYVDYLAANGYLPPDGKEWVDQIRQVGNMATHEINIMKRSEAAELIMFLEMLLKFIYEYPAIMKIKAKESKALSQDT